MNAYHHTLILFSSLLLCCAACTNNKTGKQQDNGTGDSISVHSGFNKYFQDCHTDGSIVVYDLSKQKWVASDTTGIYRETLPASTFKILNLLIALETGVIGSINDTVRWPGHIDTSKYGYRPETYHDMPVREAFETSSGWVFGELAKDIGRIQYNQYLSSCSYGNQKISHQDDFWNFGELGISPIGQVNFLKRFYENRLPFSRQHMDIVKEVMLTEQNNAYTIRSKTGWTRDGGINTGWWVGFIETKNGSYIFATRLLQDRSNNRADFGSCRKDITMSVLKDLKIVSEEKR